MKFSRVILLLALSLPSLATTTQWEVENKSEQSGRIQTIEIPLSDLEMGQDARYPIVKNSQGVELPSQLCYDGKLIFQLSLDAKQKELISIKLSEEIPQYEAKVYGRFVPERKDDWAWENDRIAYRLYGQGNLAAGWLSNGIDVWLKRTSKMIIEEWYDTNDYHVDHGEGVDCYDVSRTLGMGALSPMRSGALDLGSNFLSGKTLDNGPIRYTMELDYPERSIKQGTVKEKRIISLDAGAQLNKITVIFQSSDDFHVDAAIGFIKRSAECSRRVTANSLAYAEPCPKNHGIIYAGAITKEPSQHAIIDDHECVLVKLQSNVPFSYYSGAGWSKYGFHSLEQWANYLKEIQEAQHQYSLKKL